MYHDFFRSLFLGCVFSLLSTSALAVVYVKADATGANNGTNWADAYNDLQTALAATSADEIWVAAGTYYPGASGDSAATFQLKNKVSLYGGFNGTETSRSQRDWNTNVTILSGDIDQDGSIIGNSSRVVTASNTNITAVLDGFTVKLGGYSGGGTGMYVDHGSPTIRHCEFSDNMSDFCGVYLHNSTPIIEFTSFVNNWARYRGAGLCSDSALTLTDVDFISNTVQVGSSEASGAGLYYDGAGTLSITRGHFIDNLGDQYYTLSNAGAYGAGALILGGDFVIRDSVFEGNRANAGGGLYTYTAGTIINTVFMNNTAYGTEMPSGQTLGNFGAAIAATDFSNTNVTVINSVLANNTAGEGAGIAAYQSSTADIRNSILWNNTATGVGISLRAAQVNGNFNVDYSIVAGLLSDPGGGTYPGSSESDPLFVNLAQNDFHLQAASPAIDAGNNASVPPTSPNDLDGNLRKADVPGVPDTGAGTAPIVDMGAYEYASTAPAATTDLVLTSTDTPDPVIVGKPLNYSVLVTNIGTLTAKNVTVIDRLPSGVTLNGVSTSRGLCVPGTTTKCFIGNLSAGATVSALITVTPGSTGTLKNIATTKTSSSEADLTNNTAIVQTTVDPVTPSCYGGSAILTVNTVDENQLGIAGASITITGPNGCTQWTKTSTGGGARWFNLVAGEYTVTPTLTNCPFVPQSSVVQLDTTAKTTFVGDGCN